MNAKEPPYSRAMICITAACDSEAELMKSPLKARPLLERHFNLRAGDGFSPGKGLQAQNTIAREDELKIKKGREAGSNSGIPHRLVSRSGNGLGGKQWRSPPSRLLARNSVGIAR
jgi:hypothetical protein